MVINWGTLYLCPTPIGNLEDITLRALRVLKEADIIAAEDTRHTKKLLNHFEISTQLLSYREQNHRKMGPALISKLKKGEKVALVSDAGMPGISDPGFELVKLAVEEGVRVEVLPGPSAFTTALVASALPPMPFSFWGFIPQRGKERVKILEEVAAEKKTVVLYESPHRIRRTLKDLEKFCGDRQVAVGRELTKKFEEIKRGSLKELLNYFTEKEPRGEFTIVLAGGEGLEGIVEEIEDNRSAEELVDCLIEEGLEKKEAIKKAAQLKGLPKREVYNSYHQKR